MQNSTETETAAQTESNILRIVDWVDSNEYLTPEDVMERALDDYRDAAPEDRYKKVMVITLDDGVDGYQAGFYAGNMKSSEMVALIGVVQHKLLSQLSGLSE